MEQVEQQGLQRGFADAEYAQEAGFDVHAAATGQIGGQLTVEHVLQLAGRAGEYGDGVVVVLDDAAGGRAAEVGHDDAAGGEVGLFDVVGGHFAADAGHVGDDRVETGLMELHGKVEVFGDHFLGEIVLGGAETAGGDDDVGAAQGFAQRFADTAGIVADDDVTVERHAQLG